MRLSGPKQTIARARQLRKAMTKPERLLWWALRRHAPEFRFRRQHPAGCYVLDFYCDAANLCVEVDGQSHDFRIAQDQRRDRWLLDKGIMTLRFSAADVLSNLEGVLTLIVEEARGRK